MEYDIAIIGAGAGGGTLAYALKDSGLKVLIIEQGDYIPQEEENESLDAAYGGKRYGLTPRTRNIYNRKRLSDFGNISCVGGRTKIYGSALVRFRKEDFGVLRHQDGISPAWPISYDELEPYYSKAEQIYSVHGHDEMEPTRPHRSSDYLHPHLPYDSYIQSVVNKLQMQGLNPSPIPLGIIAEKKHTINGKKFDGYPSKTHAKADTDVCCIRPALATGNVSILTNATAQRLHPDSTGKRIESVEITHDGSTKYIRAKRFVLSCGSIHSPALLLKSKLANSSSLVGKNLMMHTSSVVVCVHPFERNQAELQKSFQIMDYYLEGKCGWPWGCLQTLGSFPFAAFMPKRFQWLGHLITERSLQMVAISEDLPDPKNSVQLDSKGTIHVYYKSNNQKSQKRFRKHACKLLRRAYPYSIVFPIASSGSNLTTSHSCGTLAFGTDPKASVLDPFCRTHDVENLYVVDSSFFPSSGAVNPSLTIMAQALRVGEHLCKLEY